MRKRMAALTLALCLGLSGCALKKEEENASLLGLAAELGEELVLLTVENAYTGEIAELDGVLLSSKRPGEGIGLQSVAHIAEKTGGYCKFLYGNGVFTANVMLRGG